MSGKTPRWERKKNPDRLILQPRDREIMVGLYAFRLLTSQQILRLFDFGCTRRVNSRLRKLYDHHYLSRTFLPTVRGSGKSIYYLGPQGVAVVAEELGVDSVLIKKKAKKISQLRELFLAHALQLNELRITFSHAIHDHPEMSLESWIGESECGQEYSVYSYGRKMVRKFRPDGYFRFWSLGKLHSFFIELDRSTMSQARFKSKVQTYLEFARLGFYRERFGVKFFRVLVITLTAERLANIKRTVEAVTDRIFLFTTLDQITSENAFGHIWQRAGYQGLYPLVET